MSAPVDTPLVEEPAEADAVVVNTCGFVASAKKDSPPFQMMVCRVW